MAQAIIRQAGIGQEELDRGRVTAFLPRNFTARVINADTVAIDGYDHFGWTLEDYVIPRLASGSIWAEKLD